MKVLWSAKARRDLREIFARRSEFSEAAARALLVRLREAPQKLADFPDAGRVIPEFDNAFLRELIESDFRIMYERFPDRVEIFAVAHGRREFVSRESQ